ncbi:putative B3 domain-containing protein At5g66980 [Diospyros lotus]|uniref:putative B3 domain-containing protein At5g66980 n=1 Tax=Diospyros lotus TaxID=55363 RepID=UPI00224CA92F|nr:putative B3 domain-containing protein At5g66980 [Diospyros lotus]
MGWKPFKLIPPAFVAKFGGLISERSLIKDDEGRSWPVKIEKTVDGVNRIRRCFIHHDGWQTFVKDNHLQHGDFLVFRLASKSVFKVVAYDPTCCEKKLMVNPQIRGGSSSDEGEARRSIRSGQRVDEGATAAAAAGGGRSSPEEGTSGNPIIISPQQQEVSSPESTPKRSRSLAEIYETCNPAILES